MEKETEEQFCKCNTCYWNNKCLKDGDCEECEYYDSLEENDSEDTCRDFYRKAFFEYIEQFNLKGGNNQLVQKIR